jgi:hypothetical protein
MTLAATAMQPIFIVDQHKGRVVFTAKPMYWIICPENSHRHDRSFSLRRFIHRLDHQRGLQYLSRDFPSGGYRLRRTLWAGIGDYHGAALYTARHARRTSGASRQPLDLPDIQQCHVATRLRLSLRSGTHIQSIAQPAPSHEMQIIYRLPGALLNTQAKDNRLVLHPSRTKAGQWRTL